MTRTRPTIQRMALAAESCGVLFLLACSGCVSVGSRPDLAVSTTAGRQLLDASLRAHGSESFARIRDIAVSYDGEWKSAVWLFQPILIDKGFRKRSEERILLPNLEIGQRHFGPEGEKHVFRTAGDVEVWYRGVANEIPLRDQAAAAVADGYAMFLLGPFYFLLRHAVIDVDRPTVVDGRPCDQVLAILRPGFGSSPEDRVLIAIDSENHLVRRLRFTFNALPSTQGVVADVLPTKYVRIDGVYWPTEFVEIIKNPLVNLTVHRWRVTGLDTNRGLTLEDVSGESFGEIARPRAGVDSHASQSVGG